MKYLLAIIIFGLIIFIHELGHFIAAKSCGVKVLKFAVGMGPKLIGKTIGETEYSVRLLPLGGFCAMEGENTDAVTQYELGEAAHADSDRSLKNKPVWQRFIISVAGPFMNILLGFVLAVVLTCMMTKVPTNEVSKFHTVSEQNTTLSAESYEGGLREGDIIVKIDDMRIFTPNDISYKIKTGGNKTFDLVVERDGAQVTLNNVSFGDKANKTIIDFYIRGLSKNPINVVSYAAKDTLSTGRLIWVSLIDLVTGKYSFSEMSGPVGVVSEIGKAATSGSTVKESAMTLMSLTMFITVNLGIVNLLPIPGLDGGHILFLIIEAIRRKPIKPEHEGIVNLVGLGLVMLLIVAVTFSDIMKMIG